VYEYNSASQPVEMSAMKFRRITGSIIRSGHFVRMRDDWSKVSE
jgi:hypothetical protein